MECNQHFVKFSSELYFFRYLFKKSTKNQVEFHGIDDTLGFPVISIKSHF